MELMIVGCVREGWDRFRKNIGVSIGVVLIYAIITMVGGAVPVIKVAMNLVITPVLTGGVVIFAMKIVRGQEGKIEDLFQGFYRFGGFLGAYWLYVGIALLAFIPAAIGFGIDASIHGDVRGMVNDWTVQGSLTYVPRYTIALGAVSIVILIPVMLRLSMAYYLIVDGMKVIDAFRESARITKGFVWKLFLLSLLNALVVLAGFLAILVGLLAAIPVAMFAYAVAYTRLRGGVPTSVLWPPAGKEGDVRGAS